MQRILPLLSLLCWIGVSSAQQSNRQPLIIQGKLSNSPEKFLRIYFYDEADRMIFDTLKLDDQGEFYLKTYKITRPHRTNIQQNSTHINKIYVAPGYHLKITGDATNYTTLLASKKITGIGEESNRYRVVRDAALMAAVDKRAWYERKPEEVLPYIQAEKRLDDSVHQSVFDLPQAKDPYFNFFEKMIEIDNQSMFLTTVLESAMNSGYNKEQMKAVLDRNTPPIFRNGITNDDYLIAEDYTRWAVPLYLQFRTKLDKLEDSVSVQAPDYALKLINQLFTGKVREYVLRYTITRPIGGALSIEALNDARKRTQPLYDAISSAVVKQDIVKSYSDKEYELMQLQVGKPAPAFSLKDDRGKIHQLTDFKGKVIYIDLWASWCEPCRVEMPNFKALKNKFLNNEKVTFIGIAVSDGEKDWRKALSEEKPDWLQLHDADGSVGKSYVAGAIPKYILIDKNGRVANPNAPSPGDKSIERLINEEIAR